MKLSEKFSVKTLASGNTHMLILLMIHFMDITAINCMKTYHRDILCDQTGDIRFVSGGEGVHVERKDWG